MRHFSIALLAAAAAAVPLPAQLIAYGSPSPAGFAATLDSGGQVPFAGNGLFQLRINGSANPLGGLLGISGAAASIPIGATTLLIDPATMILITLPPSLTVLPVPLPPGPGLAGVTAFAQIGLGDAGVAGGFGLTNGIAVTFLPDRTPTRAYFGGQDFSGGAATGQLSVLDLTTVPPSFRATGALGFAGTISTNFSPKIAVAADVRIAYALGNGTTNQFVRVIDVSSDPVGLVTWTVLGDIPIAREIVTTVGRRDMEVLDNNALLFVVSGGSSSSTAVVLDVFDTTTVPGSLPAAPVQSLTFAGAGGGVVGVDLSPDNNRLAVLVSADTSPALTIYDIVLGAPQPLAPVGTYTFANYATSSYPNDVHWSPDGTRILVSGGNGVFSVLDATVSPPAVVLDNVTWSTAGTTTTHGSAVALRNGSLAAVLGEPATTGVANYNVVELNPTSPAFGTVLTSFSTNPGLNISNHRSHARQNIVIAIDGTGATANCQWVDVIDLNQPVGSGFAFWRVQTPSTTSLTPGGLSCIPRDFDML